MLTRFYGRRGRIEEDLEFAVRRHATRIEEDLEFREGMCHDRRRDFDGYSRVKRTRIISRDYGD